MMTDRSHIQLIEDHVQADVKKSSRRRRHNPFLSKPRFKNIIHATIRSKTNTNSTDTKRFHQHDNLHSTLTTAHTHHHHHRRRQDSRRTLIIENSVKRSKSTARPVSITKIHQFHPSPSQSSCNAWENDDSKKNLELESTRENSHQTIFKATMSPSKLPTVVYQTTNIDDDFHSIKTIDDAWSDRTDTINDYHKNLKRDKKKTKCPRLCIIVSVIGALIAGIIVTAIPLALLVKPQTTIITTTNTPTTPIVNPCANGSLWNTVGVTYAGSTTLGNALNLLNSPSGIFMNTNDLLYISDTGNYRVLKYLPSATSGILVAGIGTTGNALNQFGTSIRFSYIDSNQNVYVSDNSNHRVMRWTTGASAGVIVAGNGTSGTSLNQVSNPYSVWVDSSSNVFVAEYQNHRVTKWSPGATAGIIVAGGNGSGTTPDKLWSPTGLFYDETNQDLYIANANSHAVMKWQVGASTGVVVAGVSGSVGSTSTQLNWPMGLTLDQWNNIYVVDRLNFRIQLFCSGNLTGITIAGAGSGGSSLVMPYGVAFDSRFNLYVSDYGIGRVLKFSRL